MLPELKKVSLFVVGGAVAGALAGVLIGALTDNYLLWIGVLAGAGVALGLAIVYGFLPDS
jgi:hypothetical protein